ncbi:MAG: threonine synthase [Clostridiales bacterium 38-18]|nr:MAG: threonine synthase [Clostridiales bacterium 38-18]
MSEIKYQSTRSKTENKTFAEAVIQGISPDGGLYVPTQFPKFDIHCSDFLAMSYPQLAESIFKPYMPELTTATIKSNVNSAYDTKFSSDDIAPLKTLGEGSFIELFHGKTQAFKDMALSILPYFMLTSIAHTKSEESVLILTATSGDTGKAALEGFADVSGIDIAVFYPTDGVSDIQKKQMTTQTGDNVHVFGINGNFDDAQTAVKTLFNDEDLKALLGERGYRFSSANSINIGRLLPQIIYYFNSYKLLVKAGTIALGAPINICVPTGNFGNLLAAYYAMHMGLPVHQFICASNQNHILTDFINTGIYDTNRAFHTTTSPSMDILISSNLERLLYHLSGGDTEQIQQLMNGLKTSGRYEVSPMIKAKLDSFYGGYADEAKTQLEIKTTFTQDHYLIDPHTAVAYSVYKDYVKATGDHTHTLIAATASPYKFADSVLEALGHDATEGTPFDRIRKLSEITGTEIPKEIAALESAEVKHGGTIEKTEIRSTVAGLL